MESSLIPALSFTPLFKELLARRGLTHPEEIEKFITADLDHLEDPFLMKGMQEAVHRIHRALAAGEKILVHGDYDVDGVTGTAVVARTLELLKGRPETFLPDRIRDGYGVNIQALGKAHERGASLLITVDCGITAHKQIEQARSWGMDVIVIDHHRLPAEGLPPASVILNPQQADCPYPFKDLSAAGLAFKLSHALLGNSAFKFLDLAALSTVSDIAPLRGENRIIVKKGLELFSERSHLGLRALSAVSGIKSRHMNTGHLGFIFGPKINASGRMSSPDIALRLLLTDNAREAESLAAVLHEENKLRQKEERQTVKEAVWEVEKTVNFNRDRVLVVAREGWHPGVVGIVASRLVDKYHRPSVVIAVQKGVGKGSGRSIKHFHLFNAMDGLRDLFEEFGGHEQAVGLTIAEKNIASLRKSLNQHAAETYPHAIFKKEQAVDLEIEWDGLQAVFVHELKLLEPHGAGNPRPVFMTRNLEIKGKPRRLGGEALQLWVSDGGITREVAARESTLQDRTLLEGGRKLDLVYSVKTCVREGIESLVLDAREIRPQE